MKLVTLIKSLTGHVTDFLYPRNAEVYKLESLSPAELLNTLPAGKDLGESTIALFAYGDPQVRQIIHELKYRNNSILAKNLAIILMDTLRSELAERALTENFKDPLLIPIPMSSTRRRERGWNQTELLCEEVKKLDNENLFTYTPSLLIKLKHTESQTHVGRNARLANVRDTMLASDTVRGKNIVLLDDVTTTGATFAEAKRRLRESGASKILCIAIAH